MVNTQTSKTTETTETTKRGTKTRRKASTSNKPKQVSVEEVEASSSKAKPQKEKTVEEVYKKKSQHEHILLRPDTYVGSVEPLKEKMWVHDSELQRLVYR